MPVPGGAPVTVGCGGCLLGAVALVTLVAGLLIGPRLHLGDGVFLRDAAIPQAPVHLWGAEGPAVIVPLGPGRPATYRATDAWGPALVVPGTAADLRAAIDAAELARALLAIAAVSLGSAPLAAALLCGLVGP
jgi:hypothetical protein